MKLFFSLLFFCCLMTGAYFDVNGQISVPKRTLRVTYTNMTTSSSAVLTKSVTIANGTSDTCFITVEGGDQTSAIHFWTEMNKNTGTTDSNYVTIWGICKSSETGNNTTYKSLYSDQTANADGAQIFSHVFTGNNYTNYMIVSRRGSVLTTAQNSTYKYAVLLR